MFLTNRYFLATTGLVLSMYAVYVEYKVEHKSADEEFTALCDIEAIHASCSQVFALPVGKMMSYFGIVPKGHPLDLPNAALGVIYYTWQLLLADAVPEVTQVLTVVAFLSSVFLAYQLTFVVFELCVLCWSTHVINTTMFIKMLKSRKTAKLKTA